MSHAVFAAAAAQVWSVGAALLALPVWASVALRLHQLRIDRHRPRWVTWCVDEPLFVHWGACVLGTLMWLPVALLPVPRAAATAYAIGAVIAAWSVWVRRRWVRTRRVRVPIRDLPEPLVGFRIAHLSDLHIGSFDPEATGLAWVRRTNALEPDLIAVTGDLVTSGTAYYEDVARVLGELRAPRGVFVCLGNHDQWDPDALLRAIEARGPMVLRNASARVPELPLRVAGVDDRKTQRDDLDAALADCPSQQMTLLLAHYPEHFADAARAGVALTLSGHTHGGQLAMPGLPALNPATLTGQCAGGAYRRGDSHLYVSRGLGTTGPPMRLGVAPEIVLLELVRAPG